MGREAGREGKGKEVNRLLIIISQQMSRFQLDFMEKMFRQDWLVCERVGRGEGENSRIGTFSNCVLTQDFFLLGCSSESSSRWSSIVSAFQATSNNSYKRGFHERLRIHLFHLLCGQPELLKDFALAFPAAGTTSSFEGDRRPANGSLSWIMLAW